MAIPQRNFSACYSINNKYLGIMCDETKAVEISEDQFRTCQQADRQFCSLNTPLLSLTHPPTCISALYAKDKASIQKKMFTTDQRSQKCSTPMSIAPNVWIITSPFAALQSGIMLICPREAPRSIIPQTPLHII